MDITFHLCICISYVSYGATSHVVVNLVCSIICAQIIKHNAPSSTVSAWPGEEVGGGT